MMIVRRLVWGLLLLLGSLSMAQQADLYIVHFNDV